MTLCRPAGGVLVGGRRRSCWTARCWSRPSGLPRKAAKDTKYQFLDLFFRNKTSEARQLRFFLFKLWLLGFKGTFDGETSGILTTIFLRDPTKPFSFIKTKRLYLLINRRFSLQGGCWYFSISAHYERHRRHANAGKNNNTRMTDFSLLAKIQSSHWSAPPTPRTSQTADHWMTHHGGRCCTLLWCRPLLFFLWVITRTRSKKRQNTERQRSADAERCRTCRSVRSVADPGAQVIAFL